MTILAMFIMNFSGLIMSIWTKIEEIISFLLDAAMLSSIGVGIYRLYTNGAFTKLAEFIGKLFVAA